LGSGLKNKIHLNNNTLLISELENKDNDIFELLSLLERHIFESSEFSLSTLDVIVERCAKSIEEIEDELEKAERIINDIFIENMFIENEQREWPVSACELNSAIANRQISPALKSVVLRYILSECGFETDIVFVPEKLMIRIVCNEVYAIIFDPITGESLNGYELDKKLEDVNEDPQKQELYSLTKQEIFVNHITSMKAALIREKRYSEAFKCVEILLALKPDDPLERRDRGFLLQQLDCFKVAYDDYRYFVESCPKDPAAKLLKLQLEHIEVSEAVLH